MRKLIAVAAACSVFGGVVGSLATAATQSQASPTAIAAAVQRVQDQSADRSLRGIKSDLDTLGGRIHTLAQNFNGARFSLPGQEINDLAQICKYVSPSSLGLGCEPLSPPVNTLARR